MASAAEVRAYAIPPPIRKRNGMPRLATQFVTFEHFGTRLTPILRAAGLKHGIAAELASGVGRVFNDNDHAVGVPADDALVAAWQAAASDAAFLAKIATLKGRAFDSRKAAIKPLSELSGEQVGWRRGGRTPRAAVRSTG